MLQQLGRVEVDDLMTAEDFFILAPADKKAELIDGVMVIMPPPSDKHEDLQLFLLTLLRMYCDENDLGIIRGSRTAVQFAIDEVFQPDLLFVPSGNRPRITDKGLDFAPDFVIEILSASTAKYDRQEKFYAYEREGVKEYWIIDPYGPSGSTFFKREGKRLKQFWVDGEGWANSSAISGFRIRPEWLWPAESFIKVSQALKEIVG